MLLVRNINVVMGHKNMKIAIFLHGTTIMHKNAVGKGQKERVRQSVKREASVLDYSSYVPIENAVKKLKKWVKQGASVIYLSSHEAVEDVEKDKSVLARYGFPEGKVFFRQHDEEYKDIVERIMPDVLIEDDCESLGGEKEMIYPHIKPQFKDKVRSIVVKEFEGIDSLPDDIESLLDR